MAARSSSPGEAHGNPHDEHGVEGMAGKLPGDIERAAYDK